MNLLFRILPFHDVNFSRFVCIKIHIRTFQFQQCGDPPESSPGWACVGRKMPEMLELHVLRPAADTTYEPHEPKPLISHQSD